MNILTLRKRAPKWKWETDKTFGKTEYHGRRKKDRVVLYRMNGRWFVQYVWPWNSGRCSSRLEDWLLSNGGKE